MRRALVLGLLLIAGCGTGLGGTSLSEAREACKLANNVAGYPLLDSEWDTILIVMRAMRDDGVSKVEALNFFPGFCNEQWELDPDLCTICITKIVDALW